MSPPDLPVASSSADSEEAIQVGVLSYDSAVVTRERYAALADVLSEAVGHEFVIVPVDLNEQFALVSERDIEFAITHSLASVQLRRLYNTQFIATMSRPTTGEQFGGQIIVRTDSDIRTVEDLNGKTVACVNFRLAAGGCIFQIDYLGDRGIDPFEAFGEFIEIPSQDNIILAVLNGTIDAGFVRTGQLEKIIVTHPELSNVTSDIRVLEPMDDGFYYPHTTQLYPEWPISAVEGVDPELIGAVQEALLSLPQNHPALEAANLSGFVSPADYSEFDRLIEDLQLTGGEIAEPNDISESAQTGGQP